jgi:hypothetical protein
LLVSGDGSYELWVMGYEYWKSEKVDKEKK